MGLMLGILLVPSTAETRRYRMILWGCRLVALPLAILAFVLTAKNFCAYSLTACRTPCVPATTIGQGRPVKHAMDTARIELTTPHRQRGPRE